jgi:hypothetical protein
LGRRDVPADNEVGEACDSLNTAPAAKSLHLILIVRAPD